MNYRYFIGLILYINLGSMIFGYSIGVFNSGWKPYATVTGIDITDDSTDPKKGRQVIIQSLTTGGSAVGALFAGFVSGLGRWKCLLLCNVMTVVGAMLTLLF